MRVLVFEGELAARKDDDRQQTGELFVRVTQFEQQDFDTIEGKRVRVTIEIIENSESFDNLIGSEEIATPEDLDPFPYEVDDATTK
jgi:hypothetical protein